MKHIPSKLQRSLLYAAASTFTSAQRGIEIPNVLAKMPRPDLQAVLALVSAPVAQRTSTSSCTDSLPKPRSRGQSISREHFLPEVSPLQHPSIGTPIDVLCIVSRKACPSLGPQTHAYITLANQKIRLENSFLRWISPFAGLGRWPPVHFCWKPWHTQARQ